jgi:UDP-glucose 4-epimerase
MDGKRVMITGNRGFIGSNLARYLAKDNSVVGFDLKERFDVRNLKDLKNSMKGVDYVFHLAALISVEESMKKPEEYISTNILGTLNVLRAASEENVQKVVFASSAAVYGDSDVNPKTEDMPLSPKSVYAMTKVAGECFMNCKDFGIETISLRFFNVYGPGQGLKGSYSSVIPIFIDNALKNKDIIIYGTGKQSRDFVFVDDVTRSCVFAAEKGDGVFNIGSGIPTSVNSLAENIIRLTDSSSKIIHVKEREGDILESLADISKVSKALGFKPENDMERGLKRAMEWFRTNG